ncbi:spore germination protein GerPE [Lentibacillus cibarius]|uniref:Spore germination protein GerPE n=1 Tax=Lentibacillus cibarius TaxID=2583219 RepID=A0A549YJ14_9BACI|nr:spore germination protein GerPE [Lentibacillus cibarius]TRM11873.1 spore germination protein GerPE [Lentibacillus cibarius]
MQQRTSSVRNIKLNGLTYSGIFNIGDAVYASTKAKGIAVQKEGAVFSGDDGVQFENYSLFDMETNLPEQQQPVQKTTLQHKETIHVGDINLLGVSQAAIFQVGSIREVTSEARIKHFRRLMDDNTHTNQADS